MPDLYVLITQLYRARVTLTVETDTQVVHESKCKTAVGPRLRNISKPALLGTQKKEGLDGRDRADTPVQLVEEHTPGMFSEHSTPIVGFVEELLRGRVAFPPTNGMREDSIKKGVGVVWS